MTVIHFLPNGRVTTACGVDAWTVRYCTSSPADWARMKRDGIACAGCAATGA